MVIPEIIYKFVAIMHSTWKGYYIYGNGFTLPYFGEKINVTFEIEIDDHQFSGTCTEEENSLAQDMEATIEGFIEEQFVSFTKTFPFPLNFQDADEVGKKPQELIHEGLFDSETNTMYGSWILPSFAQIELVEREVSMEGLWFLKKDE